MCKDLIIMTYLGLSVVKFVISITLLVLAFGMHLNAITTKPTPTILSSFE